MNNNCKSKWIKFSNEKTNWPESWNEEIGRIKVWGQPMQKSYWDLILTNKDGCGGTCLSPSYVQGITGKISVQLAWGKTQDPILKITKAKRAEGKAQVVESTCLASARPWIQHPPPHQYKTKACWLDLEKRTQIYTAYNKITSW
jgi:hypothetical protein